MGNFDGAELIEWQFWKLLSTVTHGDPCISPCDLVHADICITEASFPESVFAPIV